MRLWKLVTPPMHPPIFPRSPRPIQPQRCHKHHLQVIIPEPSNGAAPIYGTSTLTHPDSGAYTSLNIAALASSNYCAPTLPQHIIQLHCLQFPKTSSKSAAYTSPTRPPAPLPTLPRHTLPPTCPPTPPPMLSPTPLPTLPLTPTLSLTHHQLRCPQLPLLLRHFHAAADASPVFAANACSDTPPKLPPTIS